MTQAWLRERALFGEQEPVSAFAEAVARWLIEGAALTIGAAPRANLMAAAA